jgi:hypothetical protein
MLVFALGIALIAISRLAEPATWTWIARMGERQAERARRPQHAAVDTRLPPKANDDSVIIRPDRAAEVPAGGKHYFPGVDAKLLAEIEDNSALKPSEQPARLQLLGLLRRSDPRSLEEASLGEPAFIQLMKQTDAFRGQLVTIRGQVQGVYTVEAPKNDQGIRELHQLWIAPGARDGAIVVDCLDLPKTFPQGANLHEQVTLTGFFFKRLAYYYEPEKQMRVAPYVLAEQIDWTPQPVAAEEPAQESRLKGIVWAISIALVAAVVLMLFLLRGRRSVNPYRPAEHHSHGRGFAALDDLRQLEVSPEVSEALRRIAAGEHADDQADRGKGQP